jgi:hypothetical protein
LVVAEGHARLLSLEFWDELGARRTLPSRHHYFDFDRWAWIPELAEGGHAQHTY